MKLITKLLLVVSVFLGLGLSAAQAKDPNANLQSLMKKTNTKVPEQIRDRIDVAIANCFGATVSQRDLAFYRADLNGDRQQDYLVDWRKVKNVPVLESCNDIPCDEEGCYMHVFKSEGPDLWYMAFAGRGQRFDVVSSAGFENVSQNARLFMLDLHPQRCTPSELVDDGKKCYKFFKSENRRLIEVRRPRVEIVSED